MKFRYPVLLILAIVFLQSLHSGCRLPSAELSPEEMDIVDTLYNSRLPELRLELDSLCKLQKDEIISRKTDSLIELQLTEIRKLVERQ